MFTIYGTIPSKSNSYKIGNKTLYKSDAVKNWEKNASIQLLNYKKKKTDTIFILVVNVFMVNKNQDLDNTLKVLLDVLQKAKIISNDRNCVRIEIEKFIDKNNPRVEFELK